MKMFEVLKRWFGRTSKAVGQSGRSVRSLAGFLRGMYLHDIAKPFFLGREKHTLLGFVWMSVLGMTDESLAVLFHHELGARESLYYPNFVLLEAVRRTQNASGTSPAAGPTSVPYWAFLAAQLDNWASSAYGLSESGIKGLNLWSRQNPFSRLCGALDKYPVSGSQGNEPAELHRQLWEGLFAGAFDGIPPVDNPISRQEILLKVINPCLRAMRDSGREQTHDESQTERPEPHQDTVEKFARNVQDLQDKFCRSDYMNCLKGYVDSIEKQQSPTPYSCFSERTYPSPNDTSLMEHGKLTAGLAMVLAVNLRQDGHVDLFKTFSVDADSFPDARKDILDHHRTVLLRISFAAFKGLFENGLRLDDLQGVRGLLGFPENDGKATKATYRSAFQRHFAKHLALLMDDPGLEPWVRPLNDFAFDQVYLLPGSLGDDQILQAVESAAIEAGRWTGEHLAKEFARDFEALQTASGESVQAPGLDVKSLGAQVQAFAPYCHLRRVDMSPNLPEGFPEFKKQYAHALSAVYSSLWNEQIVSRDHAARRFDTVEDNGVADNQSGVCDVCGIHRPFVEFYKFYEAQPEEVRFELRKVMYNYKEETEGLCAFCLGCRVLSHGTVKEAWLSKMLRWKEPDGPSQQGQAITIKRRGTLQNMEAPPALLHSCKVKVQESTSVNGKGKIQRTSTADMGACFVRIRNHELQVFPTLLSGADGDSNLALLHLEPNLKEVFASYRFDHLLKNPGEEGPDLDKAADWHAFSQFNLEAFSKALRQMENKLAGKPPEERQEKLAALKDEMLCSEPHLARVFTRIGWIRDFYHRLRDALSEAGIRTLKLESDFPRLLVLIPADRLPDAVDTLLQAVTRDLFSSRVLSASSSEPDINVQHDHCSAQFLNMILPPLMAGAVTVFKARQPLYQVMHEAREGVSRARSKCTPGFALHFMDLRGGLGVLSNGEPFILSLSELLAVLPCLQVPRRHLLGLHSIASTYGSETGSKLERALRHLFAMKHFWGNDTRIRSGLDNEKVFGGATFLQVASKGRTRVRRSGTSLRARLRNGDREPKKVE